VAIRQGPALGGPHEASTGTRDGLVKGLQYSETTLPTATQCVYPGLAGGPSLSNVRLTVRVRVRVEADGRVSAAEVERSVPGLDSLALTAARSWVFRPGVERGKPIAMDLRLQFNFGAFSRDSGSKACK